MKYKRLIANIIDHISVSIITGIIVSIIVGSFIDNSELGLGATPFLIMIACFFSSCTSGYLLFWIIIAVLQGNIRYIGEIGPYISVIISIIIVQTIILSIVEICTNGSTIGRGNFKIKVVSDNGNYTLTKAFCRNFIKSTSQYLFYIPYISLLFCKNNKTIYDKILGTSIVQNDKSHN